MRLLVAGRGDSRQFRSAQVSFLGVVREMPSLYAAADIFLLPTIYDPFSNACLEALAAGRPVITTRGNGFSEIIENGRHGSVVDNPCDIDALSEALRFWSDPARRAQAQLDNLALAAQFDMPRKRRADARDSGERTRLACWFRRHAETISMSGPTHHCEKVHDGESPSSARESRALPGSGGGQGRIDVRENQEDLVEPRDFENRPDAILQTRQDELPPVGFDVLHSFDEHRQTRAVDVRDGGKIHHQARWFLFDHGASAAEMRGETCKSISPSRGRTLEAFRQSHGQVRFGKIVTLPARVNRSPAEDLLHFVHVREIIKKKVGLVRR